jgi:integrase
MASRVVSSGQSIGWHTFRHTYRSWLDDTRAPMGVQQKLMRHAQISTTMNVYGSAYMEGKREAHTKVVKMVLPRANEKAAIVVAAS